MSELPLVVKGELSLSDLCNEVARLSSEKKRLKAELDRVSNELGELEPIVLEKMQQESIPSVFCAKYGETVHIRQEIWPAAVVREDGTTATRDEIIEAMKEAGPEWEALVHETYNAQTLRAVVIRLPRDENNEPVIPDSLSGVLRAKVDYKIATRKKA